MDIALVVALVSGTVTLAVAIGTAVWTSRLQGKLTTLKAESDKALQAHQHELEQAAKREERLSEAKTVLDRYREPLLIAANDLCHRIHNIRTRNFLVYLDSDDHRARIALLSSLYRFASYFGWIQTLERQLNYLHLETEQDTKDVAETLARIG